MRYIAHRGNRKGPNPERENTFEYIMEALDFGFDCEIDVWLYDDKFYLGHNDPDRSIADFVSTSNMEFLHQPGLWIHCKNMESLAHLSRDPLVNCFYHDTDAYTLTSKGYIWAYPGSPILPRVGAITVVFGSESPLPGYDGFCSDYVGLHKKWDPTLERISK